MLVLVFSPHCRFSVRVAPHVNALARAFPLLEVGAVDATRHRGVAHKFGVAGVPSLVLFQNNKMVAKLNDTEGERGEEEEKEEEEEYDSIHSPHSLTASSIDKRGMG